MKTEQQLIEIEAAVSTKPQLILALPIHQATLAPPILYPGTLYCAGANYADHVLEMSGKPPPA